MGYNVQNLDTFLPSYIDIYDPASNRCIDEIELELSEEETALFVRLIDRCGLFPLLDDPGNIQSMIEDSEGRAFLSAFFPLDFFQENFLPILSGEIALREKITGFLDKHAQALSAKPEVIYNAYYKKA